MQAAAAADCTPSGILKACSPHSGLLEGYTVHCLQMAILLLPASRAVLLSSTLASVVLLPTHLQASSILQQRVQQAATARAALTSGQQRSKPEVPSALVSVDHVGWPDNSLLVIGAHQPGILRVVNLHRRACADTSVHVLTGNPCTHHAFGGSRLVVQLTLRSNSCSFISLPYASLVAP